MLNVCVSASSTVGLALTCDLREELGTTATSEDARMNRLILRASAWAETYVGRDLRAQIYQETVPAFDSPYLMLSRYPIIAVLRMFDTTATCTATEYCSTMYRIEDSEAGILSRDAGFTWTADRRQSASDLSLGLTEAILPGRETKPWLVEYVAGYIFPQAATSNGIYTTQGGTTSTAPTLPTDLGDAVLLKAKQYFEGGGDIKSRKVGDLQIQYVDRRDRELEELISPFRSV